MNIKLYSFFSGVGFLDLGFENAGFNINFVNERNSSFLTAYKFAREKMNLRKPKLGYFEGDISEFLRGKKKQELLKDVNDDKGDSLVGFIGGPPCPDFSSAGKNLGVIGENGKLTEVYKKIIVQQMPDFFLLENVKGLWQTKKHRQFYEKLKISFKRKGYLLIEKLVNSLEYGVPQDRERIILIGIQKEVCKYDFSEMKRRLFNFNWGNDIHFNSEVIKAMNWPTFNKFVENSETQCPEGILKELTVEHWFLRNNVDHHFNSKDYFKPRAGREKIESIMEGDVSRKSYKRLHRWRYAPTMAFGNNEVHLHPYKSRRISIAEALALQSLPPDFVISPKLTLSEKFKTVGNGVPYLMSLGIAKELKKFLITNVDKNIVKERSICTQMSTLKETWTN